MTLDSVLNVLVPIIIFGGIIIFIYSKAKKPIDTFFGKLKDLIQKAYWKGRFEGWKNCEDMAISRAKKCKYDMNKFLPDILQ